jgi:hypothetical protein
MSRLACFAGRPILPGPDQGRYQIGDGRPFLVAQIPLARRPCRRPSALSPDTPLTLRAPNTRAPLTPCLTSPQIPNSYTDRHLHRRRHLRRMRMRPMRPIRPPAQRPDTGSTTRAPSCATPRNAPPPPYRQPGSQDLHQGVIPLFHNAQLHEHQPGRPLQRQQRSKPSPDNMPRRHRGRMSASTTCAFRESRSSRWRATPIRTAPTGGR